MSAPGNGQADIGDVLRRLGPEPLVAELEAAGLGVRGDRCRCPFEGCADKGEGARRNLQIFREGKPHVFCFACSGSGDFVDVLQATRGMSREEALAHARGQPAPARPPLQLVRQPEAPPDAGKLKPEEVRRLWKDMLASDEECERYLEGRGLEEARGLELVRFASRQHPDKRVTAHARRDYRIAMLLRDVVGNERGIQMRLCRRASGSREDPWMSVKGSAPGRGFFGHPELVEASAVICVAEGGADTLAVSIWTQGHAGLAVVGLPGKDSAYKLAGELEAAGVSVAGKLFLLFTQNDRPLNKSRRSFERLRQLLVGRGARAFHVRLAEESKDIADWLQLHRDAEWPPEDVREAYAAGSGDDEEAPAPGESPFAAVMPAPESEQRWGQDFDTLCCLLEEPSHREAVIGRRGELSLSEMTHEVAVGGRVVAEEDLHVVRRRIERYAKTPTGKAIRFGHLDIAAALRAVAREKTVHPVRQWLESLKWDGEPRLDIELPAAMGQREGGFTATLLSRWMLSAVARPLFPGCKVDTVLVLVGPQGIGKSTFFNILAGDDWFTDSEVNIGDKDGKMLIRRMWLVEWAELDAVRRARDKESVRAFISSRVDDFREPYGHAMVRAPRSCVIVGTSNNIRFLHDKERRFLPVEVSTIDLEWVRTHREQCLAEAVHRVRAGQPWHFLREEMEELFELQEHHQEIDPWTELIAEWIRKYDAEHLCNPLRAVRVSEVLELAIGKPAGQWVAGKDSSRVADCLRALGWDGPRRRFEGQVGSWWVRGGHPEQLEMKP